MMYGYLNSQALVDINKQSEPARFLRTLASGACATTWAEVTEHVRDVAQVRVIGDSHLEALHVTHVFVQICRSYLFNTHQTITCEPCWAETLQYKRGHIDWNCKRARDATNEGSLTGLVTALGCHTFMWHSGARICSSRGFCDGCAPTWGTEFPELNAAVVKIEFSNELETTVFRPPWRANGRVTRLRSNTLPWMKRRALKHTLLRCVS